MLNYIYIRYVDISSQVGSLTDFMIWNLFLFFTIYVLLYSHLIFFVGRRGRDRMVVGFTTTYAISAYHHRSFEFKSCSWRGVLDTTLCGKVCQWLAAGLLFSLSNTFSSTNKTDYHDITEILLKVALNTIILTLDFLWLFGYCITMIAKATTKICPMIDFIDLSKDQEVRLCVTM